MRKLLVAIIAVTLLQAGNCFFSAAQSSSVITGPTATWNGGAIPSCFNPDSSVASIIVTIPAGVTITGLLVTDSYYASLLNFAQKQDGYLWFTTSCGRDPLNPAVYWTIQAPKPGWNASGYSIISNQDMKQTLSCCYQPSCTEQTFSLNMFLKRDFDFSGDTDCDTSSIYYNPATPYPFSAHIVGHTVEGSWRVSPDTICSSNCNLTLKCTANYGVPPYSLSHPWVTGSSTFGSYSSVNSICTSMGTDSVVLTIPVCPANPDSLFLIVPAPVITDACGNTVAGLQADTIWFKSKMDVTLSVPAVACQDGPPVILAGTPVGGTFSGTGVTDSIFDVTQATGKYAISYTVTDSANCVATAMDTLTLTLCTGVSQLNANGFIISPNPSGGFFKVSSSSKISKLQVVNIQGQIIFDEEFINPNKNDFIMDLGNEAKGIYFLQAITENGIVNRKLVLE